jgi:hypothetical protein
MSKFRNISGKISTHRAENIFLKYLLYNVHEIARKYPREKKRYSSFSDSAVLDCAFEETAHHVGADSLCHELRRGSGSRVHYHQATSPLASIIILLLFSITVRISTGGDLNEGFPGDVSAVSTTVPDLAQSLQS